MNIADIEWPGRIFITGTGTDVGKSFATGWLARELRNAGIRCITQKMIQTGNIGRSEDIERHREIMGTGMTDDDLGMLTAPQIFSYPCSPHLASRIDGRPIDFEAIDSATDALAGKWEVVLMEGAGGLMVPLVGDYLTADFVKDRHLPAVVVVSGQLGSINHALLTLHALKSYGILLLGIIYNPFFDRDHTICGDTKEYLRDWAERNFNRPFWLEMPVIA